MTTWKLLPQEHTPNEGAFCAIDELVVTRSALELFGEVEVQRALVILVTGAIVARLDYFQVIERDDAQCLYAVDDDGVVTLMLPEDW
jgi:hypothetical protein